MSRASTGWRRRGLLALLVTCALAGATATSAVARDGYVTSFDGTKIVYSFFPDPALKAGQRAPTVMFGPGYGSARANSSDPTVSGLLAAGYNVLTWDPRGFGDSGGDVELDSPAYEARDVSALIDYIAQQPEAQLDAPGNPRVGMVGDSYGGGIQLTSAEVDPRIDVIAPQIAWNSLITALDKSNTAKGGWASLLAALGAEGSTTGGILGGLEGEPAGYHVDMQDPRIYTALEDGLTTGEFTPADQAFLGAAGPASMLNRIHIPVLLMQGTDDTLSTPHEAITNYETLKAHGVPIQMLWFCGSLTDNPGVAHGQCLTPKGPDPEITLHFELRWLARYLKRETDVDTGPGFTWISDRGVEHTTPIYPPAPGSAVTGSGSGLLPLAVGDTSGALIVASRAVNAVNVALSTPAAGTELVGEPTLTLDYSGTATNSDDRLYAQIISNSNGLVLGDDPGSGSSQLRPRLDARPALHGLLLPLPRRDSGRLPVPLAAARPRATRGPPGARSRDPAADRQPSLRTQGHPPGRPADDRPAAAAPGQRLPGRPQPLVPGAGRDQPRRVEGPQGQGPGDRGRQPDPDRQAPGREVPAQLLMRWGGPPASRGRALRKRHGRRSGPPHARPLAAPPPG
jgi:ABC-2 type transport system ATP-binding protein